MIQGHRRSITKEFSRVLDKYIATWMNNGEQLMILGHRHYPLGSKRRRSQQQLLQNTLPAFQAPPPRAQHRQHASRRTASSSTRKAKEETRE